MTTHTTKQCALQGNPDPELDSRVKAVESVLVAMAPKQSEPRTAGHLAYAGYGTATAALFVGAAFSAPAAPVVSPVLSGGSTDKRDGREGPGPRRPPTGLTDHIECIGALGNHP